MINELGIAEEIAREAHKGQKRWGGEPYIIHPKAVANQCDSNDAKVVAWLHDVIEDTDVNYNDLEKKGIRRQLVNTLDYLTKLPKENYKDYILNISEDKLATEVKIADLKQNLSDLKKGNRRDKYLLALHILENKQ